MQMPDLQALQRGDAAAWDMAFPWLWPAAFGAAQVALQPNFPAEVEDVAIEALEALVEKVRKVRFLYRHKGFAHLRNELASPE
jgi:hypothetical protein